MNAAKNIKAYYESIDYKNNYLDAWYDLLTYHEPTIRETLLRYAKYELNMDWDTRHNLVHQRHLENLAQYIYDNFGSAEYWKDYWNYFVVTDYCLLSISFGEQEEPLDHYYWNKCKARVIRDFEKEDFYVDVDTDMAYYNMTNQGLMLSCEMIFELKDEHLDTEALAERFTGIMTGKIN